LYRFCRTPDSNPFLATPPIAVPSASRLLYPNYLFLPPRPFQYLDSFPEPPLLLPLRPLDHNLASHFLFPDDLENYNVIESSIKETEEKEEIATEVTKVSRGRVTVS
jgi:hypothetical protein